MEYCLLIVNGEDFDPHAFLSISPIQPDTVFVKGRIGPTRGKASETSGFTVEIGFGELGEQIGSATEFLKVHKSEIERLKNDVTIEKLYLHLGHACRLNSIVLQEEWIPPEFMRRAGELGIHVCLSHRKSISENSERQ